MTTSRIRRILAVLTLGSLVTLAACGGSDDAADAGGETSAVATTVATGEEPTTTVMAEPMNFADQWERVDAPEDCMCGDGSPFAFFVREADPAKVVFYLEGGGACFSAETCNPDDPAYTTEIGNEDGFEAVDGIFDLDNPENPFADWSIVYVPYCTGDVHSGNITKDYGDGVVVEHKGYVNASAALDALIAQFPGTTQLVVAGSSAGSFPTPLYAAVASEQLPAADVKVIADGSGAIPDAMGLIASTWSVLDNLPDWPELADVTYDQFTPAYLFIKAAERNSSIAFARHDYAFDRVLSGYALLAGLTPDDLVEVMTVNEEKVEAAGATVTNWIAPGDDHTILGRAEFYSEELNGVRFVEWLTAFLAGESPDDQYCTDCEG